MKKPILIGLTALLCCLVAVGCVEQGAVQIGAVIPLSGSYSVYGQEIQRGMELALEEVQTNGGLEFEVSLRIEDSGSDPAQAANLLADVYTTAMAAIGGVSSAEALAMVPAADEAGKLLLSPTASSPELSGISKNFFRIFLSSEAESVAMAPFVVDKLKQEQVAVLAASDAFGQGAADSFENAWSGEMLGRFEFDADSADIAGPVSEAVATGAQAIYVAATGDSLVRAIQSLRDNGFVQTSPEKRAFILASSALASPEVLGAAGRAASGSYMTQTVFDPNDENEPTKSFVAAYEAKHQKKPDLYSAYGYDSVIVLVEALKEGGFMLPGDVAKGMKTLSNFPGVTGNIQFRENNDVQKFARVYYIDEQLNPVDFDEYMKARMDELREKRDEIRRQLERANREAAANS